MEEETAVDWFANRIKHGGLVSKKKFDELLEQAIAIEKAAKAKESLRGYNDAKSFDNLMDDIQNQ